MGGQPICRPEKPLVAMIVTGAPRAAAAMAAEEVVIAMSTSPAIRALIEVVPAVI